MLPVHNGECRLRKNVGELLELASELTAKFGVLIIDDGSTDSTFEVAEELAAHFPQVSVRRHRQYRGLGASIDFAQRVRSDAVILHDGVTPINLHQVRKLWKRWIANHESDTSAPSTLEAPWESSADLSGVTALQCSLERAHRTLSGFQFISTCDDSQMEWLNATPEQSSLKPITRRSERGEGIGRIPPLPRPKFLTALTTFALGE